MLSTTALLSANLLPKGTRECTSSQFKNSAAWRSTENRILFVKPIAGTKVDDKLKRRIRDSIIANLSRRHVPAIILECPEIPYTTTMKRVEVAVKKIINVCFSASLTFTDRLLAEREHQGSSLEKVNQSALLNPESLKWFVQKPELQFDGPVVKPLAKL
jgi:acetoacetyl-CoA synthetase